MWKVFSISWMASAALILGWGAFGSLAFFPIGAFAAVACLYFSWAEALVWVLSLSLLTESGLPVSFGALAIPLTASTLLIQLIARHQFRASFVGKILLGVLLQAVATVVFSLQWPPRTVAGAVLQGVQIIGVGALAGVGTLLVLWGLEEFSRRCFELDLESRIKDL